MPDQKNNGIVTAAAVVMVLTIAAIVLYFLWPAKGQTEEDRPKVPGKNASPNDWRQFAINQSEYLGIPLNEYLYRTQRSTADTGSQRVQLWAALTASKGLFSGTWDYLQADTKNFLDKEEAGKLLEAHGYIYNGAMYVAPVVNGVPLYSPGVDLSGSNGFGYIYNLPNDVITGSAGNGVNRDILKQYGL